jgi:hypothetical protein
MAALKHLAELAALAGGVVIAGHLAPVLVVLIALAGALALLVIVPAVYDTKDKGLNARKVLRIIFGRKDDVD